MAYDDAPSIVVWQLAGGLLLRTRCECAALTLPPGAPPVIVLPESWDLARQDEAVAAHMLALERRRSGLVATLARLMALCAAAVPLV